MDRENTEQGRQEEKRERKRRQMGSREVSKGAAGARVFRAVVVITWVQHTEGPGFDPKQRTYRSGEI